MKGRTARRLARSLGVAAMSRTSHIALTFAVQESEAEAVDHVMSPTNIVDGGLHGDRGGAGCGGSRHPVSLVTGVRLPGWRRP